MLKKIVDQDNFSVSGVKFGVISLKINDSSKSFSIVPKYDYANWSENIKIYFKKNGAKPELMLYIQERLNPLSFYDVIDKKNDETAGLLRYHFGQWEILDKDDKYFMITRDSLLKEIFSLKYYPYYIVDQHEKILVKIIKTSSAFRPWVYSYSLDFSLDKKNALDKRLALAVVIMFVLNNERKLTFEKLKLYVYLKLRRIFRKSTEAKELAKAAKESK
jgi:hypothetical protein